MYTYKKREMTPREIEGAFLNILMRAMVRFQKIHAQRTLELAGNEKWQKVLEEVKTEVTDGFLQRCDLKIIQSYTKELEAMDVHEILVESLREAANRSQQLVADTLQRVMYPPKGPKLYQVRRRARAWVDRPPKVPTHVSH